MSVDPMQEVVERLKVDICSELYDRFMMGGWEPVEAHDYIRDILEYVWRSGAEWMRGEAAALCNRLSDNQSDHGHYHTATMLQEVAAHQIESLPLLPDGKKEPK